MKRITKYIMIFLALFIFADKIYALNDYAFLNDGPVVNNMLKTLAGNENVSNSLVDENITKNLSVMLDEYGFRRLNHWNSQESMKEIDAYYGSVCPVTLAFVQARKPVMIADYRV